MLLCSSKAFSQTTEPVFDLFALDFKDEIKTEYLFRYLDEIVSIEADGIRGQGIRVGRNLILTDFSLVANKRKVTYQTQDDLTSKSIYRRLYCSG